MSAPRWTLGLAMVLACHSGPLDERTARVASAVTVMTTVDPATSLRVSATAADVRCNGDGQLTLAMEQTPPVRYALFLDDGKQVTSAGFDAAKAIATSIAQAKTNGTFDVLRTGWKNALDFSFSTNQSSSIVADAIGELAYRATEERDLGTAIEVMAQDHDATSAGSLWNASPSVAVILTDGRVGAGACNALPELTSRNIVPVVVTVGPNVDTSAVACFTGGGARLITSFSIANLDAAVRTASPPQEFVVEGTPGSAFELLEPFTTSTGAATLVGGKLEWQDYPPSSVIIPFHHSAALATSPSTLLGGIRISRKSSPTTTAALPDVAIDVTGTCAPVVDGEAPALILTSSKSPSIVRETVTFTAKIRNTGDAPAGTVAFADGATPLGAGPIASGEATFQTATLAGGTHTITATYSTLTASLSQAVNRASTTTTVVASGQPVTLTATVSSTHLGTISGSLVFADGDTNLGTVTLANGTGRVTTTLTDGPHSFRVEYSGDEVFAPSAGALGVSGRAPSETSDAGTGEEGSSTSPLTTDDGCGCRTAPAPSRSSVAFVAGALLFFWFWRRRRR